MAGMTDRKDGSGVEPGVDGPGRERVLWLIRAHDRQRLQQVGPGDEALRVALVGDQQRLLSPASSSTASRTGSSLETAGNGGSITSAISASSSAGSWAACLSSPRSPIAPTTVPGSCAETTGSCETRCSCSSETASRTL